MIRRSRIQAVNVRQQHERVGLDHLGDERSKSIIVAETQLAGGHRVVLVEDWHDAEAEEPREGRAHVRVVVAAHHVVRGQQHLGGVEVMRLEGGGPPRHQESLAHRGGGLHARQVLRLGRKTERIQPRGDSARGDNHDLAVAPAPAGHEASDGVNTVQVQTAVLARERGGSDLDDNARSRGHSAHD